MVFRLTQKLGKKIGVSPSRCLPLDASPFADWHGHLFTAERTQYIIVTNSASLYSVVTYGRGITDDNKFIQRAFGRLRELMAEDGKEFLFQRFIAPRTGRVTFSKTGDRRVLGSINDLVYHAKLQLLVDGLPPSDASFRLNEMPMSYLNYDSPVTAFRSLAPPEPGVSPKRGPM